MILNVTEDDTFRKLKRVSFLEARKEVIGWLRNKDDLRKEHEVLWNIGWTIKEYEFELYKVVDSSL